MLKIYLEILLLAITFGRIKSLPDFIPKMLQSYYEQNNSAGGVYCYFCRKSDTSIANKLLLEVSENSVLFNLKTLKYNETTINIHLDFDKPFQGIGVFLDMSCQNGKEFFKKCSVDNLFNASYNWLVWAENLTEITIILNKSNISLMTNLTVAVPGVTLFEFYKIHVSLDSIITEIGNYYYKNNSLIVHNNRSNRRNFNGFKFNVTVMFSGIKFNHSNLIEQLLDHSSIPDVDPNIVNKYSLSLFLALSEIHNMSYHYIPTGIWGTIDPSLPGMWTGSVGYIQRREAEFSVTSHRFRSDRYNISDYFWSFNKFRFSFIFIQPAIFGSFNALIVPFENDVWLYFINLIILCLGAYKIISFFDSNITGNESWGTALISTVGSIAQQGIEDPSRRPSIRIVSFFLLIFTYIIMLYYGAAVLSGLLSPTPNSVTSFSQLLKSKIQLGLIDISTFREVRSRESVIFTLDADTDLMLSKMAKYEKLYYSIDEGIQKIKEGKFALYSEDTILYRPISLKMTETEICSLYSIEKLSPSPGGFLAQENSHYKELFVRSFNLMMERGLAKRMYDYWFPPKPHCQFKLKTISIGAESLIVAYLIFGIGLVISLSIFFIECLNK